MTPSFKIEAKFGPEILLDGPSKQVEVDGKRLDGEIYFGFLDLELDMHVLRQAHPDKDHKGNNR